MVYSFALGTLPSTTRLFADFWDAKPAVRSLVPRHFREPAALAEQAGLVDARTYDRRLLCEVLREQNERFGAGPAALASIARLEKSTALVAIGGQQAGLFGGPLYTVHKALTILAVARHAEKTLQRPVVPVFWIASEDSDLAEVDNTLRHGQRREARRASDARLGPRKGARLADPAGRGHRPAPRRAGAAPPGG